jgi:condensin complex subunit 3
LYKIHVSLGKIVNSLMEKEKLGSSTSRKSSAVPGERTVLGLGDDADAGEEESEEKTELMKVEEERDDERTILVNVAGDETKLAGQRDSLVESLLSDDDDDDDDDVEMSGV